jgi:hypothetical protein
MIEVYKKGKRKEKIVGYIDGSRYLTRKKKLCGYLEDNIAKHKKGYPLLVLFPDGKITNNKDFDYREQGYIKEGRIYSLDNTPIFTLHKEKGEIHAHLNEKIYYLRGGNIDNLTDLDFFGIATVHLELFGDTTVDDDDDDD